MPFLEADWGGDDAVACVPVVIDGPGHCDHLHPIACIRAGPSSTETHAPAEAGYLGAETKGLDVGTIKALGLAQNHAILIVLPVARGPAETVGLLPGDVIMSLNGLPVPERTEYIQNIK